MRGKHLASSFMYTIVTEKTVSYLPLDIVSPLLYFLKKKKKSDFDLTKLMSWQIHNLKNTSLRNCSWASPGIPIGSAYEDGGS